jgi:hypothetical protein
VSHQPATFILGLHLLIAITSAVKEMLYHNLVEVDFSLVFQVSLTVSNNQFNLVD